MSKFMFNHFLGGFCRTESAKVLLALVATIIALASVSVTFAGTPVYLRADSRFASGQHSRSWLEQRTKETQIQRWFRVTYAKPGDSQYGAKPLNENLYGWIAEDHVLTELKLSSITRTVREEPDRYSPSLDALRKHRVPKGAQVIVLEVQGSWSRGRVLGENTLNQDTWLLNDALVRDGANQIERGFTNQTAPLRHLPKKDLKAFDKFEAFKEFSVLRRSGDWIEIQIDAGTAWLERKNVWLASDLEDGTMRPLQAGLELRSAPTPDSNVVTRLQGNEALKAIGAHYLRWGKVKVPEHGWLWWPITDEAEDGAKALPPMQITTLDLLNRDIFDMATSPSVPGLRFASAKGLFRSRDGIRWSMIPKFEEKNFPITVAKSGVIFVGPYLSTDQGEHFEQWIRWDILVDSIKKTTGSPPQKMRLSAIEALDADGRALSLTLDVGRLHPLTVSTRDRGASWKTTPQLATN